MRISAEYTGKYTISMDTGENLKKPPFVDVMSSNEWCCIKLS